MLVATANCAHWRTTQFMAAQVAALGADVVGLQEVDRLAVRTRFAQQAGAVARAAGPGHTWAWAQGERIGLGGLLGFQGVGLVVRGGIGDRERLQLPRLPPPVGEPMGKLTGRRRRVALVARAQPANGPEVTVAVAHLALSQPEAEAQLAAVLAALGARPGPHLLLGDLNLLVEEAPLGPLVPAVTGPTYPRAAPHRCIDVVAAAGLTLGPAGPVDLACSDHLAVKAEVTEADTTAGS